MARRPIRAKQIAAMRRSLRQQPTRSINLVEWLRDRGYAQTAGEARRLILAGRVKSESHVLGVHVRQVPDPAHPGDTRDESVVHPIVPADLRGTLHVVGPKGA